MLLHIFEMRPQLALEVRSPPPSRDPGPRENLTNEIVVIRHVSTDGEYGVDRLRKRGPLATAFFCKPFALSRQPIVFSLASIRTDAPSRA